MALGIQLQDEFGSILELTGDQTNCVGRLLPQEGDLKYPMLTSIDFYGDTIFNRVQMPQFLKEWAEIGPKASTAEERALFAGIERLAQGCMDEVHLYLKFVGD